MPWSLQSWLKTCERTCLFNWIYIETHISAIRSSTMLDKRHLHLQRQSDSSESSAYRIRQILESYYKVADLFNRWLNRPECDLFEFLSTETLRWTARQGAVLLYEKCICMFLVPRKHKLDRNGRKFNRMAYFKDNCDTDRILPYRTDVYAKLGSLR